MKRIAKLTIRSLDDGLKVRLRVEAARKGHSMEEEVRSILQRALSAPAPEAGLGTRIHQRFALLGGAEPDLPRRSFSAVARAAAFRRVSSPPVATDASTPAS